MSQQADLPVDPADDEGPVTRLIGPGERPSGVFARVDPSAHRPAPPGYEILAILGQGGMGVAYKAWDKRKGRVVALKMLRRADQAGQEHLSRIRSEAEAVGRLQHPNIVQIHDVGEMDGRPFLSLEFVDGGSLDRKLNGTPLRARHSARVVETLARAIHFAHERGIVHRDLKPANVLLQETVGRSQGSGVRGQESEGRGQKAASVKDSMMLVPEPWFPKITDFGLAKFMVGDSLCRTKTGAVLGTPSYMAPEQADGRNKEVGPATDIYALGVILYELLVGRPPFRGETPMETMRLLLYHEPVPISHLRLNVRPELEKVCFKCLEKDPANRYASAAALADDLRRFLNDELHTEEPSAEESSDEEPGPEAMEPGRRWWQRLFGPQS